MKVLVTSDLHGYLPSIEPCDILCICGDICPTLSHGKVFQEQWVRNEFISWVNSIPSKDVVFIAGNHDFYFENKSKDVFDYFPDKLHYLCNDSIEIFSNNKKLEIFGTPYCKQFGNWAFMLGDAYLHKKFNEIPYGIDILLSHDAPMLKDAGVILDSSDHYDAGNWVLAGFISDRQPKYAFCGHIHSGQHTMQQIGCTQIANVSLCNELYQPTNDILCVEI